MTAGSELRIRALAFAARLRGAHDEGEALSWMEQRGYVEINPSAAGEVVTLTESGIERADAIIGHDEGVLNR